MVTNLYLLKNHSVKKLTKELPENGWKLRTLNYLLKKLYESDSIGRKRSKMMRLMSGVLG